MTLAEELAGVVVRIQELKGRIESSKDESITWFDRLELTELRNRLGRMKKKLRF